MNNHINHTFKVLVCALLCGTSVQAWDSFMSAITLGGSTLKDTDKIIKKELICYNKNRESPNFESTNKTWKDYKDHLIRIEKPTLTQDVDAFMKIKYYDKKKHCKDVYKIEIDKP